MTQAERIARYERVMGDTTTLRGAGPFIVRLWDGMDGAWCDCTGPVPVEKALQLWEDRTKEGTKQIKYDEIDYYRIFDADTRMPFSGDREMFR